MVSTTVLARLHIFPVTDLEILCEALRANPNDPQCLACANVDTKQVSERQLPGGLIATPIKAIGSPELSPQPLTDAWPCIWAGAPRGLDAPLKRSNNSCAGPVCNKMLQAASWCGWGACLWSTAVVLVRLAKFICTPAAPRPNAASGEPRVC